MDRLPVSEGLGSFGEIRLVPETRGAPGDGSHRRGERGHSSPERGDLSERGVPPLRLERVGESGEHPAVAFVGGGRREPGEERFPKGVRLPEQAVGPRGGGLRVRGEGGAPARVEVGESGARGAEFGEPEDPGEPVVPLRRVLESDLRDRGKAGDRPEQAAGEDPGGVGAGEAPGPVALRVAGSAARRARLEHRPRDAVPEQLPGSLPRVPVHGFGQVGLAGAEEADPLRAFLEPDLRPRRSEPDPHLGTLGRQGEGAPQGLGDEAAPAMPAVVADRLAEQAGGNHDADLRSALGHGGNLAGARGR